MLKTVVQGSILMIVFCVFIASNSIAFESTGSVGDDLDSVSGPTISVVEVLTPVVDQFDVFKVEFDFEQNYKNPFDPNEIDVWAVFTSPEGEITRWPAFFYEYPYAHAKHLYYVGWKVRYTPIEPGTYLFCIEATDNTGTTMTEPIEFDVTYVSPEEFPGLVRISEGNPLYFEFSRTGAPFFGIGHNLGWSWNSSVDEMAGWFEELTDYGGNFTRIWICGGLGVTSRTFHLEDKELGPNWYRQDNAHKIDLLIEEASKANLRIMASLETFTFLQIEERWYGEWAHNPYNSANGGPLDSPEEFWTNSQAKQYFRNRIRYFIARWGYSPYIIIWQLMNEADGASNYDAHLAAQWHKEMAQYINEIDPWQRPVTTSFAHQTGTSEPIDSLDEIDIVITHKYDAPDMAWEMDYWNRYKISQYNKPHIIGEFAAQYDRLQDDVDGIHFHNGIWASTMSGSAATAMLWWWDQYVHPRGLFVQYEPLADFIQGFPFNKPVENILARGYRSEGNVSVRHPEGGLSGIRILGLRNYNSSDIMLWLQNEHHTFEKQIIEARTYDKNLRGRVIITDLSNGTYKVTYWDTWAGGVIDEIFMEVNDGRLEFYIDGLEKDVAVRIRKVYMD